MTNTNFLLKKNLIVPATGNPSKGYLLFPAGLFALSYDIYPRPKLGQIDVTLTVVEIATNETAWLLGTYNITEAGFTNVANLEAYNTYLATKQALYEDAEAKAVINNAAIEALAQDPNNVTLQEELASAFAAYETALQLYSDLPVVEKEIEVINRYSEVIGFFRGDGTLTNEGVEWAKTVSFMGENLGNYIM